MDFKKKQKFSIRKLTLGTVSVFLGATLVLGNNVVEANELEKTEQKSEEKVKIGYLGVDEKDLNDIEKKLIEKKDIREEVAKENDTYVVVYKGKEAVKNVLPKTGLSGDILNLLIAGGLILCIYRLGKKKATLIGIVIVTTISGVTSLKTIKAEEVLKEIFKNTVVYKENSNLEKLDLDNFEYLGYIKDENIPTNTRLYKLVEEYKKNNLLEKEEAKHTEEVEQPKETPNVEKGKSDSTVEEKPKEEVNPTEEEKPGEVTNPAEEVEQPKETSNVEEEKSDSTVEEKPSAETTTTEEVEQPKETPNVEEGKSDSTVEEKPSAETTTTEEVEQPKETPNVEEEKPESTVEEPKEETKPAEEVEQPKETPSVEAGESESTVEEKLTEETKPTEKENSDKKEPKEIEKQEKPKDNVITEEKVETTEDVTTEKETPEKEESKETEKSETPKDSIVTEEKVETTEDVTTEKETSEKEEPKETEKQEIPKDNVITEENVEPKEEVSVEKETSGKEELKDGVITEEKVEKKEEVSAEKENSDKKDPKEIEKVETTIPESEIVKQNIENSSIDNSEKEELKETKIEFKNVEHAYLYKLNNNNEFEKVLSIDTVDTDLSKYKVKAFLKDANKNIWLDVKSINLLDNKYKVDTSFDNLVSIDNNLKVTNTYSIEVAKRNEKSNDNEYNSFSDMIKAMKSKAENNNITGEYILIDNISASEISVDNNSGSYLDNYIFKGTLKSKSGKVFSITDLKKPLFNNIIDANISNINLKDVDVSNLKDSSVGSLANESYNSNIININVNGNVRGKDGVGGLIGVLRNNSRISNSSYTGIVSSLKSVGGLTSNITENSIIENSYADINISTTAADSYSVGGLTAQVNGNSSITNSYVKGTIENNGNKNLKVGGVVGGVYYSDKYTGTIDNVISFVKVKNGRDFIGNLNELKASGVTTIANNYVVNKLVDNEYTNFVNSIDNDSAKSKIKPMYTNNTLETINTNTSNIDYSNLENYKNNYNKAYENMAKLLPFYDRYTIVREANKLLENDNLNTKTIKYIKTFVGENLVKDIYSEKNNINNIVIHYTDGTKDTISVQIKGEFNNSGILEYYVSGKNIIYTPNILSKDRNLVIDNLVSEINKLEFNKDLFNWTNVANPHNDSYDKIIEKLYIKDNFSKVKNNLKSYLISLINNYDILYGTNKNFENLIISKINNNKKSILAGLTYIDRWYDFSEAKNNLLYSLDMYATNDNSLDLVIDIGSQTIDILASNITDTAYENVISRYTGKRTVTDFIKDLYEEERNNDETIESWLKKTTKAYLVRTDSSYKEAPKETIFDRLSSLGHRYWLLPLLTVKDENVYGFFTSNSSNMGIFDPYITVNKNDSSYKDELSKVKKKVDDAAHAMQRYFDVWYRILNESSSSKLAETKIQVFDGYKNKTTGIWSSEFGSGALDSVKAFAGPIRGWDAKANRAIAHAVNIRGINRVHFTGYEGLLEEGGLSTLTHEHTHNLDADVLFGGYGRRLGHGPESYARGLLQTSTVGSDTLGINLIYEIGNNYKNLLKYNSSPTRFQNADDLQQYMRGVFDVLYTLDLAEAEVILEKGKSFIESRYKKLDLLRSKGAISDDIVTSLWEIKDISNIDDLIDANVVGRNISNRVYGHNDYIELDMFEAHYGINENPNGASGGLTLRRVGFELLAEKGYYDGMIPYISGKYYYEKGSNISVANTDLYILKKIFGEKYNSYKDFRKDMFRQRDKNKEYLKSIDVWYSNKNEHINSYKDIKRLIRTAINKGNKYEVTNIKQKIYQAYLLETNEFRESIYKQK